MCPTSHVKGVEFVGCIKIADKWVIGAPPACRCPPDSTPSQAHISTALSGGLRPTGRAEEGAAQLRAGVRPGAQPAEPALRPGPAAPPVLELRLRAAAAGDGGHLRGPDGGGGAPRVVLPPGPRVAHPERGQPAGAVLECRLGPTSVFDRPQLGSAIPRVCSLFLVRLVGSVGGWGLVDKNFARCQVYVQNINHPTATIFIKI